jgi:hypothetical protein
MGTCSQVLFSYEYSCTKERFVEKGVGKKYFFCCKTGIKYLAYAGKPTNHTLGGRSTGIL